MKPPPRLGGGGGITKGQAENNNLSQTPPQAQQSCAACGQPGAPPTAGQILPSDLTIRAWAGQLRLVCRECCTIAALERAIRRPRP
jgi:hypothetical protein